MSAASKIQHIMKMATKAAFIRFLFFVKLFFHSDQAWKTCLNACRRPNKESESKYCIKSIRIATKKQFWSLKTLSLHWRKSNTGIIIISVLSGKATIFFAAPAKQSCSVEKAEILFLALLKQVYIKNLRLFLYKLRNNILKIIK